MGHGYIYKCKKCKHEEILHVGVGWICPNPVEVCADIENGNYGKGAKDFYNKYNDSGLQVEPYTAIYACKCGHVAERLHVYMKVWTEPDTKAFVPRQKCDKCGRIMKMQETPPDEIDCPECGGVMSFRVEETILWD